MVASRLARCALLLVVLLHLLLAGQALVLTPLGEIGTELEHFAVARWWAREAAPPDLTNLPPRTLSRGADPPLSAIVFALALRAVDASDVALLARRNPDIHVHDRAILLHGADEIPPFSPILRRIAWARLPGLLASVLAVLGTAAVARRLAPRSTWVPVGAAALLAFDPAFASYAGAFHETALATACAGWALAAMLGASTCSTRVSSGRLLAIGLLIGLALLASWSTAALLVTASVLLLQRRHADGGLRPAELLLGVLVLLGPFVAFNVTTYGDPLASAHVLPAAERTRLPPDVPTLTAAWDVLEELAFMAVGEWGHQADGGGEVVSAWTTVLVVGLAGLLWQLLRARERLASRVVVLLLATLAAHLAGLVVFGVDVREPRAPAVFPMLPVLFALLAAGASTWVGPRVGSLALAALFTQSLWMQAETLRAAYWPLNGADDPYLVAVDVVGTVPEDRWLPFVSITSPARDATLVDAPELRWDPGPYDARFTVHLSYRGLFTRQRTWEDDGLPLHDRYRIPDALWDGLPPGVPLEVVVVRLPTRDELATTPLDELALQASLPWRLYRRPPSPQDEDA